MYVRTLSVRNLRSIEAAKVEFLYPGREQDGDFRSEAAWPPKLPNVNVLLGVNGAGKSTLLDAVALAVLSPIIGQSGYRPRALVRRGGPAPANEARVEAALVLHDQDTIEPQNRSLPYTWPRAKITKRGDFEFIHVDDGTNPLWDGLFHEESPAFMLVGYGATRAVESSGQFDAAGRAKSRLLRYERVASLFEDSYTLRPLASWLPQWRTRNPGRYKQVVTLINKLSRQGVRFTGEMEGGDYLFTVGRARVPFGSLSDGYKAFLGWVCDLLYHVCMGCPTGKKLIDNQGIVLVDEIDLHIHPEWQRTMIPTLSAALPNMQFILSTHSPLVVGTLERTNIVHVERGRFGKVKLSRPDNETYGLSAEQLLRSDVFGLKTTRAAAFVDELDELKRKAGDGDRAAVVNLMRKAARGGGADLVSPESVPEPPDWVRKLAVRRSPT